MSKSARMMIKQGLLMALTVGSIAGLVLFLSTGLKMGVFVVVFILFLIAMGL